MIVLKRVLKTGLRAALRIPVLDRAVLALIQTRSQSPWSRRHPYDAANNVQTSGTLTGRLLTAEGTTAYGAAQPSILRQAFATIPSRRDCHFIDLGCGMGRPLLVATEFDFAAITGVEISPALGRAARRNADRFQRLHPNRRTIEIVIGDALGYELPTRKMVVFLYNPFDENAMRRLLQKIETSLAADPREFYIVYYNPVWASLLDASPWFERRYAAQLSYHQSEIGFGPDESDAVVVWQNKGNPHPLPPGDAGASVKVVRQGVSARVGA